MMSKFIIAYFFCSFFFLCFFSSGLIDSQDGLQYLTVARRIYYDHTVEMPEANWDDTTNIYMNVQKSKDGKVYAPTGLGYSLAYVPAVFMEDIFHRFAGIEPIDAFPLQNDWPVLLFASFTNAFYGALLMCTLYAFYRALAVSHTASLVLSSLLTVSSSVIIYSKHAFPHMLFASFLLLSYLSLKKYSTTLQRRYLVMAGFCYSVVVLSYNQTYILPIISLVMYYVVLRWSTLTQSIAQVGIVLKDFFSGLLGGLPLLIAYFLFNALRFGGSGVSVENSGALPNLSAPPTYVLLEGLWGLLFSPGKSIFLFSPVLLVLVFFWHKIPKRAVAEVIALVSLFLAYFFVIGTHVDNGGFALWHGDASFGPRYMFPVVPLALVLVGVTIVQLSKRAKLFVVVPLIIVGLLVQAIGLLLPYQVRFYQQADNAFINGQKLHITQYGNMLPRYSPLFTMAKLAYKRVRNVRQQYSHGMYELRLYDGFERPFDLGYSVWREVLAAGHLSFENSDQSIRSVALQFRNHQIAPESSASAQLTFFLNGRQLGSAEEISVNTEKNILLELPKEGLPAGEQHLEIRKQFLVDPPSPLKQKQVLFLQIVRINDGAQPIATIDYPYVSPISKVLFNQKYAYFGGKEQDPWTIWHMHSGVYETSFDFWWLRPLHYWDLPKGFFAGLLALNVLGFIYFGWLVIRHQA